jgi:hypothetical protein
MQMIDYTKPENYAVDFFLGHKVSGQHQSGGFDLLARWKGYDESADTWEPLINQVEDNPSLVKGYLTTLSIGDAIQIKAKIEENKGVFPVENLKMIMDE